MTSRSRSRACAVIYTVAALVLSGHCAAGSVNPSESPPVAGQEKFAKMPLVAPRFPEEPRVIDMDGFEPGRYGGDMRLLMSRSKDVRLMVVYGYARLMGYNTKFELQPDILRDVQVEEGRIFTLRLRKGHKWSDGHPFTSEDFRYWWEDVANNSELSPVGIPKVLTVEGEPPTFEAIDETTVRYTWNKPNPFFLTSLAGTRPQYIYSPSHYLRQFHKKYADSQALADKVEAAGVRGWASLHNRVDSPYKNKNTELPSLQPWINTTTPPSQRFVFVRNPYYHRVDGAGHQLPYLDRVIMNIADGKLIPAKTGAGETDLQARSLHFSDYTFLKASEARNNAQVRLWETSKGSHIALYPNLNANDEQWRKLLRDVRFRRALSMGINRAEINQVIYHGLAVEGNNSVHAQCPLYKPEYRTTWCEFDLKKANELLDAIGLVKRNKDGIRLVPDGRPMTLIVETAGEDTEQTDVLELINDSWLRLGIKLFSKPMQREVFRNRIFTGETIMSVWGGLENGVPNANMSPASLAPTEQHQLQWPKWGQYYETKGKVGEPPDMPEAKELAELNEAWRATSSEDERVKIWHRMLEIHADQQYTIGLVASVPQPLVVNRALRNVPKKGVYNWEPGAHFGIYRPDLFWFADGQ